MVAESGLAGRQTRREVADRGGVAAPVVVEHDDHALVRVADVVERLVRHAPGDRPVADYSDDVAGGVGLQPARHREPIGVGQHGAGVAVLDEVVAAFLAVGVARQPAGLTKVLEASLAAGDHLVYVGLVPRVPQDGVFGRVEHPVQCQGELHDAEVAAQVAGILGYRIDDEVAYLARQFGKIGVAQFTKVGWLPDLVQGHGTATLPRRGFGYWWGAHLGWSPGPCGTLAR